MGGANEIGDDVSDDRTAVRHVRYDPAAEASPSVLLVLAVADLVRDDPLALEPLSETVAPDAVDELVAIGGRSRVDGTLSFTYADCDVTVHASGLFEIEPLD